jgi:ATP-dependent Lon protease
MLEVLDPEQNKFFNDHYLDIPFDLSQVLFITTANSTQSIPRPLMDRMEIIEISGYTEEEKLQIANRHLLPRELKAHGLQAEQLSLSEGAVRRIIRGYTREAGVRGLQRQIGTICRKVTRRVVEDKRYWTRVAANQVVKFLGVEKYRFTPAEAESRVGIASGLAWTESGGDVLTIEAALAPGKGDLLLTGKLGDVMKESAQTALTYIKSRANELAIPPEHFARHNVHIHVPEGAVPKDGPSAGITMTTALASVFTGRRVRADAAMTGEITLRGRILPIGGLKEKVLAAYRAGIAQIILPRDNLRDLEDIPAHIRQKMRFYPAEHMEDVLDKMLEKQPDEGA